MSAPDDYRHLDINIIGGNILCEFDVQRIDEEDGPEALQAFYAHDYEIVSNLKNIILSWVDDCVMASYSVEDGTQTLEATLEALDAHAPPLGDTYRALAAQDSRKLSKIVNGPLLDAAYSAIII